MVFVFGLAATRRYVVGLVGVPLGIVVTLPSLEHFVTLVQFPKTSPNTATTAATTTQWTHDTVSQTCCRTDLADQREFVSVNDVDTHEEISRSKMLLQISMGH